MNEELDGIAPEEFPYTDVPEEVQEALVIETISQRSGVGKTLIERYKQIVNMYPRWFIDSPFLLEVA